MPYIITTATPLRGEPVGEPLDRITRTAVATLDEARDEAAYRIEQITGGDPDWEETYTDAQGCSELGNTFGPLPDGTVIDVQEVCWNWIIGMADDAGIDTELVYADAPFGKGDLAILAAFNAR